MIESRLAVDIFGTGSYAPARVMSNFDLSRMVDTSDEWIVSRTGIRERRIAAADEQTSDLATRAGVAALSAAGLTPADIDAVIVTTITGDLLFPATACLVQQKMGIPTRPSFDLQAACSGFIYGLEIGAAMIQTGSHRHILLIGAEKLSSILDWKDRSTCVLFGDGAGAVVLGAASNPAVGLLGVKTGASGADADLLYQPGGGSRQPATVETVADRLHYLRMNGREVFKRAILVMERVILELLAEQGVSAEEVDCVIPHQANFRIIDSLAERLGIPMERFFNNLDRYGNTSAASIPLALDEAVAANRVRDGDLVLFVAFGAGLTWGAALVRWSSKKRN